MARLGNRYLALLRPIGILFFSTTIVVAQNPIKNNVCTWINMVKDTIMAIGPALVLIMFTYGGIKYVFSADDPGGRKAGKMTCIHAIIGGILITLAGIVYNLLFTTWAYGFCP